MPGRRVPQLLEGMNDAHHGAEQADKRGVVSHGAEERKAALQLASLEGNGALHGLVDRGGPLVGQSQSGSGDGAGGRRMVLQTVDGAGPVTLREGAVQPAGGPLEV